jgi:hypothetical protein
VLAALRKRQFFSLVDLNEAILELVHKLNERPFRKLAGSRSELYRSIDRPAMQPLPLAPFVYAECKKARVNLDYHIELGGHYYSTPYQLVGKEVEARSTQGTVEIFHQSKRVASHVRSGKPHVASTNAAHRPKSHQQYLEWTPTRIVTTPGFCHCRVVFRTVTVGPGISPCRLPLRLWELAGFTASGDFHPAPKDRFVIVRVFVDSHLGNSARRSG